MRVNWADAERDGFRDGDEIVISTPSGSIQMKARVGDDIMPGVVSIPHAWGRNGNDAGTNDGSEWGVNVNRLSDDSVREPFTGVPVFNGIPCRMEKAPPAA